MRGVVSYREETTVPGVNKVERGVGEPRASRNVVNLKVDVHRGSPCGDRSYDIGTVEYRRRV